MSDQTVVVPVQDLGEERCEIWKEVKKVSKSIASGYDCLNCKFDVVTYDGTRPKTCYNCGGEVGPLKWRDIITNHTTVQTIKL